MTIITEDFCLSSNGDRWRLIHDHEAGSNVVRHEPNLASGGKPTETDVDEFLARSGASAQNEALRGFFQ
jgi:hypothetical protein